MATRKSGKKASFKSAARIKQLWRQAKTRAAEGKLAEEEKLLRAILDLAPDHYGSLLKLSYMAMGAGRLPIALKYANQAVQVQHADAQGHLMLGQVLSELGLPDLAEAELTIALQLDSQDVRILDSLGGVLTQQGRSAEAEALFRRALELKPDAIGIYYNLVANKKFQRGDPDIAMIEKLSDHKNKFSQDEKIWLHFSLGKVYHDCAEYDRAFVEVQQANAMMQKQLQYQPESQQKLIEQMIQAVDANFAARHKDTGYATDGPVFVLGMARSGTTLVESLLCRHPQISGIGEVPYINNLAQSSGQRLNSQLPYPQFLAELSQPLCRELGEEYVNLTQQFGMNAARIVDKTPDNFLLLGFILAVLPNARIIHCVRNPVDTCLSIYQQFFTSGMPYAYDQQHIGEYYVQYQKIMAHWQQLFPDRILNVVYEDVVMDSEQALRRMIEYCGLPWDERCQQTLNDDVKIRTASAWQARQPVYNTSVQRWRQYQKHLGPLLVALQPVLSEGAY